jgi:hypothetical protein
MVGSSETSLLLLKNSSVNLDNPLKIGGSKLAILFSYKCNFFKLVNSLNVAESSEVSSFLSNWSHVIAVNPLKVDGSIALIFLRS